MTEAWEKFLSGHWQKDRPAFPGCYPVCARGCPPGREYILVYTYKGGQHQTQKWGGWWWSEPWPDLPDPPEWKEDE